MSDAAKAQQALLAYIPQTNQTPEDKSQQEFIIRFADQTDRIRQWPNCCNGLPEFADYLDTLAVRAQTASRD